MPEDYPRAKGDYQAATSAEASSDVLLIDTSGQLIQLLESFQSLQGPGWAAILPDWASGDLVQNVGAAFVANNLGIKPEWARRRYINQIPFSTTAAGQAFLDVSRAGKRHIHETRDRFRSKGNPLAGEIYADTAMRRLDATYFAASHLFRLGLRFEAHAVARVFLEQVAWAFAVHQKKSWDEARRVSVTASISALRSVVPGVARLYGLLSERTHIALESHRLFLDFSDPMQLRLHDGKSAFAESWVLLEIADAWAVTYELTQSRHMLSFESVASVDGSLTLRPDRPFLAQSAALRTTLEAAIAELK